MGRSLGVKMWRSVRVEVGLGLWCGSGDGRSVGVNMGHIVGVEMGWGRMVKE